MANGIQDLTSIMMEGGRGDVPPQPMMGGGLGGMMPPQTPPMSPPDMGGMPPDMGGMPSPDMGGMSPDMMMAEQMPMEEEPMPMQEEQGSIEEDSVQLAGAVMERAGDNPQTAVAILEGAAGLIMQSTQQDPMMEQDPMMMAQGGPMYAMGGKYMKPKYAAEGEYLGEESDTLRQMIMDRIQNSPITSMADVTRGQGMILNEGDLMGMGRTMSDSEMGRTLSDKDMDMDMDMDKLILDMGLDAEYYNMLQDQQDLEKVIQERRK